VWFNHFHVPKLQIQGLAPNFPCSIWLCSSGNLSHLWHIKKLQTLPEEDKICISDTQEQLKSWVKCNITNAVSAQESYCVLSLLSPPCSQIRRASCTGPCLLHCIQFENSELFSKNQFAEQKLLFHQATQSLF
jgi:hypothetical protein